MSANEGMPAGGTGPPAGKAGDAYAMGKSGTERLMRQARSYAPFTRRMLDQAGLGLGAARRARPWA